MHQEDRPWADILDLWKSDEVRVGREEQTSRGRLHNDHEAYHGHWGAIVEEGTDAPKEYRDHDLVEGYQQEGSYASGDLVLSKHLLQVLQCKLV